MYNNLQKGHPTFSHLSMFRRRCLWAYAPHSLLKKIEIPASFWDKGLRSLGGIKKKAVGWSGLAFFTVRQSSLVAGLIVYLQFILRKQEKEENAHVIRTETKGSGFSKSTDTGAESFVLKDQQNRPHLQQNRSSELCTLRSLRLLGFRSKQPHYFVSIVFLVEGGTF